MLPTKESHTAGSREYDSQLPRAACPSVWLVGQSLLSSWLICPRATQDANESGLPCPAQPQTHLAFQPRPCLRKDHRPTSNEAPAPLPSAFYLQSTPLHASFNHAADKATHRLPTGIACSSCVSQFLRSESSVGEPVSQRGNHVPRCGRQAVLLDEVCLCTLQFQGTNPEDPLTAKRLLVPSARQLSPTSHKFRHRPSLNLPASPRGHIMV